MFVNKTSLNLQTLINFRFFEEISKKKIFQIVDKLSMELEDTVISRIGKDNSFTTKYTIINLPQFEPIRSLISSYFKDWKLVENCNTFTLSKEYCEFSYSPSYDMKSSKVSFSPFEKAEIYNYILNNYDENQHKNIYYKEYLSQLEKNMERKLELGQFWTSLHEVFEVTKVDENEVILLGHTDVKFLNLIKGQYCYINQDQINSFLNDEMRSFCLKS
jgi:hypothetical protein